MSDENELQNNIFAKLGLSSAKGAMLQRLVMRVLLYPIFHLWLKHLIERNYRLRAISAICREYKIPCCTPDGKFYKDEWYWADYISSKYGYFVKHSNGRDKWIWKQIHKSA